MIRSASALADMPPGEKPPYPPWKNSSGVTGRVTSIESTAHSTIQWSPAGTADSWRQCTCTTASSSTGAPAAEGRHATPSNLSGLGTAIVRHSSSWSWASTLMQSSWAAASRSQVREPTCGMNATSGGSIETLLKVPTTMPTGSPSTVPVTTATPVG